MEPTPHVCPATVAAVAGRERAGAGRGGDHRPGAAGVLRAVPAAERRARPTYYLATLLLPPAKRPYVHALYGFARYADELVDDLDTPDPGGAGRPGATQFLADLDARRARTAPGRAGPRSTPPAPGTSRASTSRRSSPACGWTSRVTGYPTYADLEHYMYGSAAVIGLQMVPILEPLDRRAPPATPATLGEAFQLSNFIRDVGRGPAPRPGLPAAGGPRPVRRHPRRPRGRAGRRRSVRELLALRDRPHPRRSTPRPSPASTCCTRPAATASAPRFVLYGGILDAVERADYQVLDRRVARAAAAAGCRVAVPAAASGRVGAADRLRRRPHQTHQASVCSTSENPNSRSSTGA